MRKAFLTLAFLLIGIIAPILACSDNSARAAEVKVRHACFAMPKPEPMKSDMDLSQMPWSENKNLSDRDINDIMNKR